MKLIVISPPNNLPGETDLVNSLFNAGLTKFHLRKPNARDEDLIDYLQKIDPSFLDRVVVHYNFDVLRIYPQVGFHFNQYSLNWLTYKGFNHKSYSAHSVREIIGLNNELFDYIFLSPIFDSISKPEYSGNFNCQQLKKFLLSGSTTSPIVALGGIDENNIDTIRNMGFYGVAVLGAIWNPFQNGDSVNFLADKFLRMKQVCQPDLMY